MGCTGHPHRFTHPGPEVRPSNTETWLRTAGTSFRIDVRDSRRTLQRNLSETCMLKAASDTVLTLTQLNAFLAASSAGSTANAELPAQ
mmetsp:Transcript_37739/g.90227  ORF Transcript_37739/g.90227 Transcript_37739/m.90227 type:complete len:88 (+) Transcript_37739:1408-1671(+)